MESPSLDSLRARRRCSEWDSQKRGRGFVCNFTFCRGKEKGRLSDGSYISLQAIPRQSSCRAQLAMAEGAESEELRDRPASSGEEQCLGSQTQWLPLIFQELLQ